MSNKSFSMWSMPLFLIFSFSVFGHDTTHIHPLITLNIVKSIRGIDEGSGKDNAYNDIYELLPELETIDIIPIDEQFLYWGTDLDPIGIAKVKLDAVLFRKYLGEDKTKSYINRLLAPISKNTITGVVYKDVPATKVINHFYQANSGAL